MPDTALHKLERPLVLGLLSMAGPRARYLVCKAVKVVMLSFLDGNR